MGGVQWVEHNEVGGAQWVGYWLEYSSCTRNGWGTVGEVLMGLKETHVD